MTLPAHRFEDRKKKNAGRTWVVDYDGTVTGAPDQMARIAQGLKALGDTIIVLTGNKGQRADLVKQLDDYGFPFDELVQYSDDGTNGIGRAHYLKQFGAWGAFDNRVDRAPILTPICPHLFVIAEPLDDSAHGTKKAAKQAAKALGLRAERRGPPRIPTQYDPNGGTPESHCGNCDMFWQGMCWGFGDVRVDPVHGKCIEWTPDTYEGDSQEEA